MSIDILILNTAVVDFRREEFDFVDELAVDGGLIKVEAQRIPNYTEQQIHEWIEQGCGNPGGPGNTAPLIARSGLKVAVGVNLGSGDFGGLDMVGRHFHDVMTSNGIDMSASYTHPTLPTGITYIHTTSGEERGGLVHCGGANDDFDFENFKPAIERLQPRIVYYMYSGVSERADANGGRDLADFVKWCRGKGAITIADSVTLTSNPMELIKSGGGAEGYKLLEPLLPELDLFFTSSDEAKLIENTFGPGRDWGRFTEHENNLHFLDFLIRRFWPRDSRTKLFGVTVNDGAYEKHIGPDNIPAGPNKIASRFMAGDVVDLVGAGDSFRSGFLAYVARNVEAFRDGSIDFSEAVQMGNLLAALYIRAPLGDRYRNIKPYEKMVKVVKSGIEYASFEALQSALN